MRWLAEDSTVPPQLAAATTIFSGFGADARVPGCHAAIAAPRRRPPRGPVFRLARGCCGAVVRLSVRGVLPLSRQHARPLVATESLFAVLLALLLLFGTELDRDATGRRGPCLVVAGGAADRRVPLAGLARQAASAPVAPRPRVELRVGAAGLARVRAGRRTWVIPHPQYVTISSASAIPGGISAPKGQFTAPGMRPGDRVDRLDLAAVALGRAGVDDDQAGAPSRAQLLGVDRVPRRAAAGRTRAARSPPRPRAPARARSRNRRAARRRPRGRSAAAATRAAPLRRRRRGRRRRRRRPRRSPPGPQPQRSPRPAEAGAGPALRPEIRDLRAEKRRARDMRFHIKIAPRLPVLERVARSRQTGRSVETFAALVPLCARGVVQSRRSTSALVERSSSPGVGSSSRSTYAAGSQRFERRNAFEQCV